MQLQKTVRHVFVQLTDSINRLSPIQFVQPCSSLFSNTIGQHVRHIIELFQCLESGYNLGIVDYDKRKRDLLIETDKELAASLLLKIYQQLDKPNKDLLLALYYDEQTSQPEHILTNYYREIAYNLEHTIHHMALIRIGINEVSDLILSEEFGVAFSTLKHRRQCAQ